MISQSAFSVNGGRHRALLLCRTCHSITPRVRACLCVCCCCFCCVFPVVFLSSCLVLRVELCSESLGFVHTFVPIFSKTHFRSLVSGHRLCSFLIKTRDIYYCLTRISISGCITCYVHYCLWTLATHQDFLMCHKRSTSACFEFVSFLQALSRNLNLTMMLHKSVFMCCIP